jgi:hypothetical protein
LTTIKRGWREVAKLKHTNRTGDRADEWVLKNCEGCGANFQIREWKTKTYSYAVRTHSRKISAGLAEPVRVRRPDGSIMRTDSTGKEVETPSKLSILRQFVAEVIH